MPRTASVLVGRRVRFAWPFDAPLDELPYEGSIIYDELVALSEVLRLAQPRDGGGGYDRVLIDTAPTGHTLRLLAAPDFLDGFLGKVGSTNV